jgi:hypothetical protein
VLEKKLDMKNINYQKVTDMEEIMKMGIMSSPVLEVDNKFMPFAEAISWVNGVE